MKSFKRELAFETSLEVKNSILEDIEWIGKNNGLKFESMQVSLEFFKTILDS